MQISDLLIILLSYVAIENYLSPTLNIFNLGFALLIMVGFIIGSSINKLYQSWRIASIQVEQIRIWRSWFSVPMIIVYLILDAYSAIPRSLLLALWLINPLTCSLVRIISRNSIRLWYKNENKFQRLAIIGATDLGHVIANRIQKNHWTGLKLIGAFEDRKHDGERTSIKKDSKLKFIGTIEKLVQMAKQGEIDTIYISLPMRSESRIKEIISRFSDSTVSIYYVPDSTTFETLHAQWHSLGDLPVLRIVDTPHDGLNFWLKRMFDITFACFALIVLAIPMLLIAIAIKITTKQSIFFKQMRYGLGGNKFEIYKFRTMSVSENGNDFVQTAQNDARVTPIGRFLRKTSLDELPQIINVIQGRMSLVGPRPHPTKLDEQYRTTIHRYAMRNKVRPGMTGLAQIMGFRGETDTFDKMKGRIDYDLEYINNWSIWLDLKIMLKTVGILFASKQAY